MGCVTVTGCDLAPVIAADQQAQWGNGVPEPELHENAFV